MDLAEAVRETIALRQNEMALRGVNLSLEEKTSLPPVLGSPGQLQQVFLNLINNAFDAILGDGAPGSITVTIHRNDSMAMVDVRDSGPGVPKEMLSRIFDPFFTTKPTGSGTGLGLSVSFRIIENHGGLFQVRSEEGKGTTFRVQIPLPEAEALVPVEVQDDTPEESGDLKGKKVLVVDDEADLRELIERALEMEGATVVSRDCVEAAFGAIGEEDWDLVLSDVITPGDRDGFDLFEEIQRTRPDLYRRVILMSGVMPSGEFQKRLETSGAHLLSKPFTVMDLLDATREVLQTPRRIPVTAPADL
jgi:CheY-like chemotaxis protein